eukprot:7375893-Prymnesium_polylepis.1
MCTATTFIIRAETGKRNHTRTPNSQEAQSAHVHPRPARCHASHRPLWVSPTGGFSPQAGGVRSFQAASPIERLPQAHTRSGRA